MTDDIVQFIEEQLALDEAGALDAAAFYDNDPEDVTWRVDEGVNESGYKRAWLVPHLGVINDLASAHHMVRHSPARVLLDVKAKRAIVAMHELHVQENSRSMVERGASEYYRYCNCQSEDGMIHGTWPCDTLKHLAAPFAGQSGFKPKWALT